MKRTFLLCSGFAFVISAVFVISSLTFALDKSIVKFQGKVMDLDFKKNMMIVNERTFFWGPNTLFYNEKGSSIAADRLRPKVWVYLEGTRYESNRKVVAEKIYLLPKYIHEKEKHLYPFIQ